MRIVILAIKNIRWNGFRSAAIALCVLGVASFLLTTTLIIRGSQNSLNAGIQRLGADMIVVPAGAEQTVESALLMGKPTGVWMPTENLNKIAAVSGVSKASPQVYLASLFGASCCSVSEMFMVVYDPQTDFTITPWFQQNLGRPGPGNYRGNHLGSGPGYSHQQARTGHSDEGLEVRGKL